MLFDKRIAMVLIPLAAACGGNVVVDGSGASGTGTPTVTATQGCFDLPVGTCPDATQAAMDLGNQVTGCDQVSGLPTRNGDQCCYTIEQIQCGGTGRPFIDGGLDGGRPRTAAPRRAGDPEAWRAGGAPLVAGLSAGVRARLAAAWTADGLLEHASIASFGRFAFELLAVGAPADLVAAAHRAAVDEVEHARLCLGLAGAYAGEPVAPAPFPFGGRVEVSADLASIAARAVREGCVGETLASIQAAEQLAGTEDPRVRGALAVIVDDEARHAERAWRFVAWALAHGGAEVRAAVAAAFAAPVALPAPGEPLPAEMAAHGRLDPSTLRAALARALEDVVRPCAERLLAAA
jgi:hypothetical protein